MSRGQRLNVTRTVEPTYSPVTLSEAKIHCRVDETDEDALISSLIVAATNYAQEIIQRQIMPASYVLALDGFPRGVRNDNCSSAIDGRDILLPYAGALAVASIAYLDTDGASQTVASADYVLSAASKPSRIALAYAQVWPDSYAQIDAVTVTYTAGFIASTENETVQQDGVPEPIKLAIKLLVSHWFENREAQIIGTVSNSIGFAVDALLSPYKIGEMF